MDDLTFYGATLNESGISGSSKPRGEMIQLPLENLIVKNYLLTENHRAVLTFGSGADQITIWPKDAKTFWIGLNKVIPLQHLIKGCSSALYQIAR